MRDIISSITEEVIVGGLEDIVVVTTELITCVATKQYDISEKGDLCQVTAQDVGSLSSSEIVIAIVAIAEGLLYRPQGDRCLRHHEDRQCRLRRHRRSVPAPPWVRHSRRHRVGHQPPHPDDFALATGKVIAASSFDEGTNISNT